MIWDNDNSDPGGLVRSTLELLILQALVHSPMDAAGLAQWIRRNSQELLQVQQGMLIPSLRSLEIRGCISDSKLGSSEAGGRVRCYELTTSGSKLAMLEWQQWQKLSQGVLEVMKAIRDCSVPAVHSRRPE